MTEIISSEAVSALVGLIFGAFGGGLVSFFFYKKQSRWEAMRQAGINALKVADAVHSNMDWKDINTGQPIPVLQQSVDIVSVRQALNELALSCKRPDVVNTFMVAIGFADISGKEETSGDSIVDLRNAIRGELGFGRLLKMDRKHSFIASVAGAKAN